MASNKITETLDHPLLFVLFITLAVCGTKALIHWGLVAANMPGPARIFA